MADFTAISTFITAELNRLDCALALCKNENWKLFLYRVSIFDQLAHLLGPTFLHESQLKVSYALKDFLAALDSGLYEIISSADDSLFLSTFSQCRLAKRCLVSTIFSKSPIVGENR